MSIKIKATIVHCVMAPSSHCICAEQSRDLVLVLQSENTLGNLLFVEDDIHRDSPDNLRF